MPNIEDSAIAYNNSESAFNPRGLNPLQRRDALRCDDGPCIDGRYVICCRRSLLSLRRANVRLAAVARTESAVTAQLTAVMAAGHNVMLPPCVANTVKMETCRVACSFAVPQRVGVV